MIIYNSKVDRFNVNSIKIDNGGSESISFLAHQLMQSGLNNLSMVAKLHLYISNK